MEIYLVGGAVRDKLLGHLPQEKDWVVVGATPESMLALGFKPVGKEFPVFLHPITHEEYALARTERKIGKGYKGFTFYTDPSVTLEEDLKRRDLTINAMAETKDGKVIDLFGGQEDLKRKLLRHVSEAFQEDPVRILRVARFATKLPEFTVHPQTMQLMQQMVDAKEVHALVPERVWQEFELALQQTAPERFFTILDECNALEVLFPEIKRHGNFPALQQVSKLFASGPIRLAALLSQLSLDSLKQLNARYPIPSVYQTLSKLLIKWGYFYRDSAKKGAEEWLAFLQNTDAFRRPLRFKEFLNAASAVYPELSLTHSTTIYKIAEEIRKIDLSNLQTQALTGEAFGKAVRNLRLAKLKLLLQNLS